VAAEKRKNVENESEEKRQNEHNEKKKKYTRKVYVSGFLSILWIQAVSRG
jgi:hypothetical protein